MTLTKADYEALAGFRRTLRRFLHNTEANARAEGITPQQHQLLLAIMGQPDRAWANVTELAEALQILHHAAVGLVNRCERAGLVLRTPGTRDRREVHVSLTPRGEEVLARLAESNRAELEMLRRSLALPFLVGQQ